MKKDLKPDERSRHSNNVNVNRHTTRGTTSDVDNSLCFFLSLNLFKCSLIVRSVGTSLLHLVLFRVKVFFISARKHLDLESFVAQNDPFDSVKMVEDRIPTRLTTLLFADLSVRNVEEFVRERERQMKRL